jgi:hypothetical protein
MTSQFATSSSSSSSSSNINTVIKEKLLCSFLDGSIML